MLQNDKRAVFTAAAKAQQAVDWMLGLASSNGMQDLLDGSLRRLSMQRDGYRAPGGGSQPRADELLLAFLNRLNAEWGMATRRPSAHAITQLTA